MSKMKADDKAEKRTFSPDLDDWMGEASKIGLEGETSKVKKTFLVGDLPGLKEEPPKVVAKEKEDVKVLERHGLHLVRSAEAGNVDTEGKNAELEDRLKKAMGNLDVLQTQVETVKAELRAILDELAVEKAKARVQGAA